MIRAELTEEELTVLSLALGMALGLCYSSKQGENKPLGKAILKATNALHRNNPNWTPYEIEGEKDDPTWRT